MNKLFLCLFLLVAPLFSATTTLTNDANNALNYSPAADFVEGDTLTLAITGAAASSAVTYSETRNGVVDPGSPFYAGQTDASGDFRLDATVTPGCCVSHKTQQWYVGGVAAGSLLDFEVIYKPTTLSVQSVTLASFPTPNCNGKTSGVEANVFFQIKSGTNNVVTLTGIAMEPNEIVQFYNQDGTGAGSGSGDIGPVSGYSDSSKFASNSGQFHDVPWGICGVGSWTSFRILVQDVYIDIGNNSYHVRNQSMYGSSSGANHGAITNNSDISISR